MSLRKSEKLEENVMELEIEVGREEFQAAIDRVFHKNKSKMSVPGFRKGKVTRKILEKYYGESIFYDEAVNDLYPAAFDAAVTEAGVEIVDTPKVSILDISADGFSFKAKITVKPEVTIKKYKGLKAAKISPVVEDIDIAQELAKLQAKSARLISVDRPAELGDTVILDYEGFVDGVAFEGGKDKGHELKLGSNKFISGFEEQLIGYSAGQSGEVKVTFPTEYHAEHLAGKEAVFKVTVQEVKYTEMDELNDEFAKDVSEFDTLDELKDDIKKRLMKVKEHNSQAKYEENLLTALLDNMEANVPEVMYETEVDEIIKDYEQRIMSQGLTMDMYLKYLGMDMDTMRANLKEEAMRRVKTRLALEKIVDLEGITVSDEELDEEYKKLAEQYKVEADKVISSIPRDIIIKDLKITKAVEFVKENAVMETVIPESAELPVKKTKTTSKAKTAKAEEGTKEAPAKPKRTRKKTEKTEEEAK